MPPIASKPNTELITAPAMMPVLEGLVAAVVVFVACELFTGVIELVAFAAGIIELAVFATAVDVALATPLSRHCPALQVRLDWQGCAAAQFQPQQPHLFKYR
jgi:hypothetical protein